MTSCVWSIAWRGDIPWCAIEGIAVVLESILADLGYML
jgi:hypothetical protein